MSMYDRVVERLKEKIVGLSLVRDIAIYTYPDEGRVSVFCDDKLFMGLVVRYINNREYVYESYNPRKADLVTTRDFVFYLKKIEGWIEDVMDKG